MSTIIIGEGLTNDVLSPQHQFQASRENVGQREIERLLGQGKTFGEGPLPAFLRAAAQARNNGAALELLFLQPADDAEGASSGAARSGDPSGFVEPIAQIASEATVLQTRHDIIPWEKLLQVLRGLSDKTAKSSGSEKGHPHFLIVGCHTEKRILAIAALLQGMLGIKNVAVSSHLVGSATQEGHMAALRHNLPGLGVHVFLDLEETAEYTGIEPGAFASFRAHPCTIEPAEARESMDEHQRRIVELLCLHWTRARLRPLAGGFSGSLLFLVDGWKGEARTEPMVVKIDAFQQMRRELDGYYQVKDFFGKHVPTFGYPVSKGNSLGVGMELAAMEGSPETLQDTFEAAAGEKTVRRFMLRLDKALSLLSEKLYKNTSEKAWIVPYRVFGLHAEQEVIWLRENAEFALQYVSESRSGAPGGNADQLATLVRLIAANEDGVESTVCLAHGDLNYANIIFDEGNNTWFIDWTHSGSWPVELDFAKLENDVKFVMTKDFDLDDLARLQKFEEYLLAQRLPSDVDGLPDTLKFAKWDLRFRKILGAVREIRRKCFALKEDDDWLVYRVALLKHAMHTLSFDKRRGRGECEVSQLMYALYSIEHLAFDLVGDDYHLRIRAERPAEYPLRQRISIDEAPWALDSPDYDPPYYVNPSVLENDRLQTPGGWADPEDVTEIKEELAERPARRRDELGRPLNPLGRTGIAGRGLLGYWGCNLSLAAVVVRTNRLEEMEILLGRTGDETELDLPKGFVLFDETPEAGLNRVMTHDAGWSPDGEGSPEVVFEGFTYDPRQTDHAWVESQAYLLFEDGGQYPDTFKPEGEFDEVKWWPLTAETVNRVPAGQAKFIRKALTKLKEKGQIEEALAEQLLAAT